jgi:hypothetical protein
LKRQRKATPLLLLITITPSISACEARPECNTDVKIALSYQDKGYKSLGVLSDVSKIKEFSELTGI